MVHPWAKCDKNPPRGSWDFAVTRFPYGRTTRKHNASGALTGRRHKNEDEVISSNASLVYKFWWGKAIIIEKQSDNVMDFCYSIVMVPVSMPINYCDITLRYTMTFLPNSHAFFNVCWGHIVVQVNNELCKLLDVDDVFCVLRFSVDDLGASRYL